MDARTQPTDEAYSEPLLEERDDELSLRENLIEPLNSLYRDVEKGFIDQRERSDRLMEFWDCYNCKLGSKQYYTGHSKMFVPIVHNAVNARKTRFTNQIFPVSGRYVECTTTDGSIPHDIISLAEHYVRKTRLRTEIMPALCRNGDVEGQYNLYVGWRKRVRHVAWKTWTPPKADGFTIPGAEEEPIIDVETETLVHGAPYVEVIADSDLLVLPATADSIDAALAQGGSVTVTRRWSKAKIEQLIEDGSIREDTASALIERFRDNKDVAGTPNKSKEMVDAAGIKGEGTKFALVYETWSHLTIADERWITVTFFGGRDLVLSCKRNPYWADTLPIISAPVEKVQGAFKGRSKLEPVADLQYYANDIANEGADSSAFTLMPIIMTDPLKNPRIGSMQLSLGAIWQTDPQSTSIHQFPDLYKSAQDILGMLQNMIMTALGVNPSMITQQGARQRQNQAQVAQEQQVEVLTTADAVTVLEDGVLTPLISRMIELDHQFRDEAMSVRQYGELGLQSSMNKIEPVQMHRHYSFRWFGVEAARNAQAQQQQIALMNVLMGLPPQHLEGYSFTAVPIVTQLVENVFGPRIAPLIFRSPQAQMPVPVEQEHMLLVNGYDVPTHQMDDDQQHIQAHTGLLQFAQASENVQQGTIKKIMVHIWQHIQQAQRKQAQQQQAAQAMQQPGLPGRPGGAGPGVAGTPGPRSGAMPALPRGGQNPPGAINPQNMMDPSVVPRNM